MGFKSAFGSLFKGEFSDAFNYAFIPESQIEANEQVADNLTRRVASQYADGLISYDRQQVLMNDIAGTAYPVLFDEFPESTPVTGFKEGLEEGADNIRGVIGSGLSGVFGITTRLIPWQLWLIAFVLVLIWAWPFLSPFVGRFVPKGK